MRYDEFQQWLRQCTTNNPAVQGNMLSRCRKVEEYEGDLDQHIATDRMVTLLSRLKYTKEDERMGHAPRHCIRMSKEANILQGTSSYASAVRLYLRFTDEWSMVLPLRQVDGLTVRIEPKFRSVRTRTSGAIWPEWQIPSDHDLLQLARITVPYIRFLHPEIVHAIVEDNARNMDDWSIRLAECGVNPALYLWERSSCAFPGVRRSSGSTEIAQHRGRLDLTQTPNALKLDDNDYPKMVWSFVFRGKAFQKRGPGGYALAHLADHKLYKNRGEAEFDRIDVGMAEPQALFGLYTSVANTCYMPVGLIRPTDFAFLLRNLVQRQADRLYGSFCFLLPPHLSIRANDSHEWALDEFQWSAPVGTMDHVDSFIEFRNQRMEELFSKVSLRSARE